MAAPERPFRVPVTAVLENSTDLHTVVVVGIDARGDLVVASSTSTPLTLAMLEAAPQRIAELATG